MKPTRIITKRFVLQVGFSCNARCTFCYYRESLKDGTVRDYSTKEVKEKLREGRKLGKDQVDISGGEPTIRKDIFEILEYAKKVGYRKRCIITNGLRLHDKDFCKKIVKAGMNDVLLSIHSPIEEQHDKLTQVKGSWKKVMKSLENVKEAGIEYRVNTTLTNLNYMHLDKFFKLVIPYKPHAVNLLVFNPSNETVKEDKDEGRIIDYNTISKEIAGAIEKYNEKVKTINVRWIPFCLLKGHEEHIRTMWQKIYEDHEWDPYLNIKYNKGMLPVILSFIGGLFIYPFRAPRYGRKDLFSWFSEVITTFRQVYYYRQLRQCRACSLRKICTGLPVDYVKRINSTRLHPYRSGKTIKDPLYFCHNYKDNFESLRISK